MNVAQKIEKNRTFRILHTTDSHKSLYGQYLTPDVIAHFMANLAVKYGKNDQNIKILDPGAGQGILFSSLIEKLFKFDEKQFFDVDAFEIDLSILDELQIHSQLVKNKYGITTNIINKDFIDSMTYDLSWGQGKKYTHIIMNPPYKKMNITSAHYRHLAEIGINTVNLYAGFLGLAIKLLSEDGVIVAIIPRSFCNGQYFLSFRKYILSTCNILHIHSFKSRSEAFSEESVLQENIILVLNRKNNEHSLVTISTSSDRQLTNYNEHNFSLEEIIKIDDSQVYFHIPINGNVKKLDLFQTSLSTLGISISTGPIVDFRMKEKLQYSYINNSTPLLYPVHFKNGRTIWPIESKKPISIILNDIDKKKLVFSTGDYVVVKRFSSKEEKRRIWASIIYEDDFEGNDFTVENHLNIYHIGKKGINRKIAIGLYVFLNSDYLDNIFRDFSGHTQVNATDLKNIKYPSQDQLIQIANIYLNNTGLLFDEIINMAVIKNVE